MPQIFSTSGRSSHYFKKNYNLCSDGVWRKRKLSPHERLKKAQYNREWKERKKEELRRRGLSTKSEGDKRREKARRKRRAEERKHDPIAREIYNAKERARIARWKANMSPEKYAEYKRKVREYGIKKYMELKSNPEKYKEFLKIRSEKFKLWYIKLKSNPEKYKEHLRKNNERRTIRNMLKT